MLHKVSKWHPPKIIPPAEVISRIFQNKISVDSHNFRFRSLHHALHIQKFVKLLQDIRRISQFHEFLAGFSVNTHNFRFRSFHALHIQKIRQTVEGSVNFTIFWRVFVIWSHCVTVMLYDEWKIEIFFNVL